ncbi:MAG: ImmA/IrrE family metallo-endopeptidase [Myxococcota bacterium]
MLAELAPATPTFDKHRFESALERVRAFTARGPETGLQKAKVEFHKAGVLLLVVPEIRGACVSGAARWIVGRPVIQLSLRHKTDDHLWFTLFHEAGHIILHGEDGSQFVDEDDGVARTAREAQADRFAEDMLIPPAAWSGFLASGDFRQGAVRTFAASQGIAPGIVVGRLQHEKRVAYSQVNHLKRAVTFISEH